MTATQSLPALNRTSAAAPAAAPVRIVHLGLGAFHRAHQAWYTQHADPGHEWGIAAFTGRSPAAAETLGAQDGLYTLVERGGDGDRHELVTSISAAYDGGDLLRLSGLLAAAATAVVTLTITEAGYLLGSDGRLDTGAAPVAADLRLLRARWQDSGTLQSAAADAEPATVPARLLVGLDARRRSGAGPIAVVPCDNLNANGTAAREAIQGLAGAVSGVLEAWVAQNVSFVDTSIDRITPRTTDEDIESVAAATGFADRSPVVTEPFRSWVLSGSFPAGRPRWEDAGAVFVERIEPFERRKLWLLNGAHSLLAYAGRLRGHATVAEALGDARCAAWTEAFWDEAAAHLDEPGLEVPAYRAALLERFGNPRIAHRLAQIAMDGSAKLRVRAVPVLSAERKAGRSGGAAARVIAAWMDYLAASGGSFEDPERQAILPLLDQPAREQTRALLAVLDPGLAADPEVPELLLRLRGSWDGAPA